MKQYITIDQLNELSQPARQKLREYMLKDWAQPMKDHLGNWVHASIPTDDYQLSIGQMIEFLYDKSGDRRYKSMSIPGSIPYEGEIKPEKLCDDLWEAVKEVLEK